VHGTADDIARAKTILDTTAATSVDTHATATATAMPVATAA
jgi:hypothetical protein